MNLLKACKPEKTGFFRHRRLGAGYLVTNDAGDFASLTEEEFGRLVSGRVPRGTALHA